MFVYWAIFIIFEEWGKVSYSKKFWFSKKIFSRNDEIILSEKRLWKIFERTNKTKWRPSKYASRDPKY